MKLVVLTPHFAPDSAPTGVVVTRIVEELAARGHRIEVLTSLPWYRGHSVQEGFGGKLVRREDTPWGEIVRIHPFPTEDKRDILRRAAGFVGFSALAAVIGSKGDPVDGVLAVSPPLTLGLDGWAIARARKARFVFNVQDVYPDVAIDLGVLKSRSVIAAARRIERFCYARADAVTVLSDDLKDNLAAKVDDPHKIEVIPNFVDTQAIRPVPKENAYRKEHGLEGKRVVMYAGNLGFSQPVELLIEAAATLRDEDVAVVINGNGAKRRELEDKARGLDNVTFVDSQPIARLPEVLGAADIQTVILRKGLGASSVPSKTYSILAAGRPLVASVDLGSEVARVLDRSAAGVAVRPESAAELTKAIRGLLENPAEMESMGAAGRRFIEDWASPAAVAEAYEQLFNRL
ncbi:MAG: glycosyltransferase family 4 protein [Actinomycetota bacterium]